MGWSYLLLPQPAGRNSFPRGFSPVCFLHLSWSRLFCSSRPVRTVCRGPVVLGFWREGGLGIWHPRFSLVGRAAGQHPRGRGCQQSVFVLWLLSGAAGSCFKSGMCKAGAARAGAIPRSFTAVHLSRSRTELKNEQNPSRSPPPAPMQGPGSFWSPGLPVRVFGSPVVAGLWLRSSMEPSLGVLRRAWHRSGGEMCCW